CLSLALYDTLSRLRVARPVAAAAAILVVANPSVILFQSILFYPYLELVLLTLAAWCLARFLTGAAAWLYPFYALLTALCLTHAVFHPLWLATAIGMSEGFRFRWRNRPRFRRGPCFFGAACLAFVFFLLLKNAALFGTPTLQSWFGMNLYNVAPKGEQARRVPQHGLIFPDAHAF